LGAVKLEQVLLLLFSIIELQDILGHTGMLGERSKIKMVVAVNKEVGTRKREKSNIRRVKTRIAIVVVIEYNLIELRDIFSRLVFVGCKFMGMI
jgi:hypothetical protein